MYPVSDAYKTAYKESVLSRALRINAGGVMLDEENILFGSFSVTNQCTGDKELKIGQVYAGELSATFRTTRIDRYSWMGREIRPYVGLLLANGSYEYVPLGVFTVHEAEWVSDGIQIRAYDNMVKFDTAYTTGREAGSAYSWANDACRRSGVTLGTTSAEFKTFQNGTQSLKLYKNSDVETWRDILAWVGQTTGTFATIDRDGKLVFRAYGSDPVDEIDVYHRDMGGAFADFVTRYTGLSVVDAATNTTRYYSVSPDNGLTYNCGKNPFLQSGSETRVSTMRRAVLTALQGIQYVPFSASSVGDPCYDLGDVLRFTDGLADSDKISCITKFTYTFNGGYKFEGAGEDPRLASGRSKNDKDLTGLQSEISSLGGYTSRYFKYINKQAITIGDGQKAVIAELEYGAGEGSDVIFHAEVKHTLETTEGGDVTNGWTETDGVMTVDYYINGHLVDTYHPVHTEFDGVHLLSLMFFFVNGEETEGKFRAELTMRGGSMSIAAGDSRAYIMGQGGEEDFEPEIDGELYIEITKYPDKQEYQQGETLDLTGVQVMAYYDDEEGTTVDITRSCIFTPADGDELTEPGIVIVTVQYTEDAETYEGQFEVYVNEPEVEPQITGIYIAAPESGVLHFWEGKEINYSGLTVMAIYDDGTEIDVTELCTISPKEGTIFSRTITDGIVTYQDYESGEEFTAEITFESAFYESIYVYRMPDTPIHAADTMLDLSGVIIHAVINDGTEEDVTAQCTFTPADGQTVSTGAVTVNVNFNGLTTSFDIEGVEVTVEAWVLSTTQGDPVYDEQAIDTENGKFELVTEYHFDGYTDSIDRGGMATVDIPTSDFQQIESVEYGGDAG